MNRVIENICKKIKEIDDAHEVAETIRHMDYNSDWGADTFLIKFEEALENELQARREAGDL